MLFKIEVRERIITRVLTNEQMCVYIVLNICACTLARVVIGCNGQIHKTIYVAKRRKGWKEGEGSYTVATLQ